MKFSYTLFLILFLFTNNIKSQNIKYVRNLLDTLCAEGMHGRGYVNKGDSIAASFIANELVKLKLDKFNNSYLQNYSFSANSFPSDMLLKIDDTKFKPGVDFLVLPFSQGINGKYNIEYLNPQIIKSKRKFKNFWKKDFSNSIIIIDTLGSNGINKEYISFFLKYNPHNIKAIIEIYDRNLVFTPSQIVKKYTHIRLRRTNFNKKAKEIEINITNEFFSEYKTQNVVGYIKGQTDSFFVYTAHYDHIGRMGKDTYFPGAHDNASGTAMLLDIARHFKSLKKKPKHSIVFIFFSGEEIGLLGSRFFTENPFFDLNKINFLLNMDLVGSGEDGIQIVNSTVFKTEYNIMKKINDNKKYLKQLKLRGAAANSDHYFFYRKGVKCFFIYTLGSYKHYHNIYDKAETLPLNEYDNLFRLLVDFYNQF